MPTLTIFEILLFESRLVSPPTQLGAESERVNAQVIVLIAIQKNLN